ncbi:MAG: antitoxin Xre/MbcA/ParS toxin-binding domain-containing protein [Thermodesulfobacteriota bacterium]
MRVSGITKVLGGEKVLRKKIRTRMDMIELSKRGISKNALAHLANYLSFTLSQIAALLPVSERTIQRCASEDQFNSFVSEQILQIAEVAAMGKEVFEDKTKFLSWMNHPNKALAQRTPASLLSSRFGIEMVLDELGRIEHGVFS